jgi:prepilin-type N-terminal cleavage/methylation domain-containing protein
MSALIKSGDEGISLVELMIAIAIVAILVSIVALNVTDVMAGVADPAMSAEKAAVQVAIDKYNTWDVAVKGAPEIAASPSAIQVSDNSTAFGKYLVAPTRFYYRWGDNGDPLFVQTR